MSWNLDKNRPICPQIVEQICVKIARGDFRPEEKLLSVRDVAVEAGVNPNTVQKSFEQLEQEGLIYSIRGSGWYVADAAELARKIVMDLIHRKTEAYFSDMALLGSSAEETKNYVKEWQK